MSQEFNDFEVEIEGGLEDVKSWGGEFRLVPPGVYTLNVIDVSREDSKKNKTPMIKVTFEVADEGEWRGAKLFGNYALTEKALGRIKNLMVACGAQLDKIRASEIMGATIRAEVVHTESEGQPDADGNPGKVRTFANVQNEMPLEEAVEDKPKAKTVAPPVTRGAQTAQPAARNGAARRA